jgi:hypothetical protein
MAEGYMKRSFPKVLERDGSLQHTAKEHMGA